MCSESHCSSDYENGTELKTREITNKCVYKFKNVCSITFVYVLVRPSGLCVYIKQFLSIPSIHIYLSLSMYLPLTTYPFSIPLYISIYLSLTHIRTRFVAFLTVTRREGRRRDSVYLCTYIYKIHKNVHNARMCVTRGEYDYKFIM